MKPAITALMAGLFVIVLNFPAIAQMSRPQPLNGKLFSFVFPSGLSAVAHEGYSSTTVEGNAYSGDRYSCERSGIDEWVVSASTYDKPCDMSQKAMIEMRDGGTKKFHPQMLKERFASFDGSPMLTSEYKTNDGTYVRQRIINTHHVIYQIIFGGSKKSSLSSPDVEKAFNSFKLKTK